MICILLSHVQLFVAAVTDNTETFDKHIQETSGLVWTLMKCDGHK